MSAQVQLGQSEGGTGPVSTCLDLARTSACPVPAQACPGLPQVGKFDLHPTVTLQMQLAKGTYR